MILSFLDKETEKVFHQELSTKLPVDVQRRAFYKLVCIDNALSINDLRCPPSNHLEKLMGDSKGWWSIRIKSIANGEFVLFQLIMVRITSM